MIQIKDSKHHQQTDYYLIIWTVVRTLAQLCCFTLETKRQELTGYKYVNSEARENLSFDLWNMWMLFLHLCLHGFVHVPNNSLKPLRQRKQEVTWPHRNAELDHLVLWGLLQYWYWKQLWQHSYHRRQQPHDGRTGSEVNDDIRRNTFVFVANMKIKIQTSVFCLH